MKRFEWIAVLFCVFFLISCMANPNIRLNAGGVEMELTQPVPISASADLSPDGRYFLTGGWKENGFKLWDINKGDLVRRFSTEKSGLNSPIYVTISPDGRYILSGGKALKLWDMSSGKEVRTIGDHGADKITSFSADGKRVLSLATVQHNPWGAYAEEFYLWDVGTWNNISKFKISPSDLILKVKGPTLSELGLPCAVALAPDGRYLLTGHLPMGMGGQLKKKAKMVLWDTNTGEIIRDVTASEGMPVLVPAVAFSPDGKYAISGGSDGTVRI